MRIVAKAAPRVVVASAAAVAAVAAGGAHAAEVIIGSPVVLVVGDPSALTAGDAAVQADLSETGYDVHVVDDSAPSAVTSDTAVVVAAASADSIQLTTKYRDAPVGVVALGYGSWVGMGVTAGPGWAQNITSTLLVVDSAHPIANGLPQVFAPANNATVLQSVSDDFVPASADTVAVRSGVATAHVVYTMSLGDLRADGSATPAQRVVLGLTDATLADLSADGLQLLGNAINWADVTAAAQLSSDESAAVTKEYTKGAWALNTYISRGGHFYTPSSVNPGTVSDPKDDGRLADNTIVKKLDGGVKIPPVAADGASALRFPGWDDGTPGNGVDPDASEVWVPHRDKFNPLGKRFKIYVYVRPRTPIVAGESPNIIQKGRVDEGNKHQWKVSFNANGMTPACTFQGAKSKTDPALARTEVYGGTAAQMTAGQRYLLTCELSEGGQAILHVSHWIQGQGFVDVNLGGFKDPTPAPGIWVAPTTEVAIGKKPRDTTNGDTYAGDIDNVKITRWEPVTS